MIIDNYNLVDNPLISIQS